MANKDTNTPQPVQIKRWIGGIGDYLKESAIPDAFYFGVSIDYRKDPQSLTLLPGAKNESGSVVTDMLKWGEIVPDTNLSSYFYGDGGNIYRRTNTGQWTLLHAAANSHGNGLAYFTGDGYLYYPTDSGLGRYGKITTSYQIYENWVTNTIDPALWFNWGGAQVTVSNQLLNITSTLASGYYGIELASAQDLTGYSVTNQLVNSGGTTITSFETYPLFVSKRNDQTNSVFWLINATGGMLAYKKVNGVNTVLASTTYNAAVHKYFKIRESLGTIYFEYSTDSTNWVAFASVSSFFPATNVTIGQFAGTFSTEVATTTTQFDNFTLAPTNDAAQFADNFLATQGGTPLNTYSLALLAASSQYATAADSASLSVTGDLTLQAFVNNTTLPAVGSSMTLVAKWDESTNRRSYRMDILGVSGFFGSGTDGTLTISSNTTQAPIDATCSATAGGTSILATNVSFASGQIILIHQTQGVNAGQAERLMIQSYSAGQIITSTPLLGSYGTGAQVIVIPQYTSITVNNTFTWKAKAWNALTKLGGILVFLNSGALTNNGTIDVSSPNTTANANVAGIGFSGGSTPPSGKGNTGEGTVGAIVIGSNAANGNGGGGGGNFTAGGSGAGGGNATKGGDGTAPSAGNGGLISGSVDGTSFTFGGGGGSNAGDGGVPGGGGGAGGSGGGILYGATASLLNSGIITANGGTGGIMNNRGGGGGAGGSIILRVQTAVLGTITANGGIGGLGSVAMGGNGGDGRIAIYYLTAVTGTTTPTANTIQDSSLVTTINYQLRFSVSSNGTNVESFTKPLPTLTTGAWSRYSVTWQAATATTTFYQGAQSLGTSIGTFTSINDNVSLLYVGAYKGASAVQSFLNGAIDDVRIWNNVQTAAQISASNVTQLTGKEGGLQAYWKLNNAATDSTGNANTLTLVNSPAYITDVPFPDASTRLDIDQVGANAGGSTYALPATISEVAADMLPFIPGKDPQKSVQFTVGTKGTGDWTVIVHDQQNREVARTTITNANIPASGGLIEFQFNPAWRIVDGKQYHFHLVSSDATGTVVSSSSNNLSTATYTTYFQFLVTDTQFHPAIPFLNYIVVGNERYLATWDGAFFQPNLIEFPAGTKVRALSTWREFLAIGTWRGNNITDYNQGKIYFWDGTAPTFNFFIEVPQGQIASLYGKDSDLYLFAGFRGVLMKYTGGGAYTNGESSAVKLKRVPKIGNSDYVDIYPGALTIWRDLVHFGLAANSSGDTLTRATYSWGSLNQLYPDTLSCDYPLSTGNTGTSVSIGLTFPVGQSLIVGWRDGVATGADVINFDNPPASSGYIQTLVEDDDALWKDKLNFDVRADHLELQSGEDVQVGISINRGVFTDGGTTSPSGDFTKLPFASGRGREYQLQATLYATGTTSPTLLALGVLHSTTPTESQW